MSDESSPDGRARESGAILIQSEPFVVRKRWLSGRTCYAFEGTCATMHATLRESLGKLNEDIQRCQSEVLLDVSKLEYANSTFVGLLATLLDRPSSDQRNFYLLGARKQLCDLLEILGILGAFDRVDSLDALPDPDPNASDPES